MFEMLSPCSNFQRLSSVLERSSKNKHSPLLRMSRRQEVEKETVFFFGCQIRPSSSKWPHMLDVSLKCIDFGRWRSLRCTAHNFQRRSSATVCVLYGHEQAAIVVRNAPQKKKDRSCKTYLSVCASLNTGYARLVLNGWHNGFGFISKF